MSGACYDWKRAVELGSNDAQKKLFENCNDDGSVKKRSVKKTYDDWLNQFVKEFDSEDYGAAIKSLSMVIELHTPSPNHSTKDELFMYRALIKGKIEDFEGALLDVKMAQSINPQGKFRDKTYPEWVTEGENKISSIESTISKEKAIAKLKELKELLELEVITQKDYDKEKAILTPIILGKN